MEQPNRHGYDADDGYEFIHRGADGEIDFRLKFHDDDGNATVTLIGGEEVDQDVNIRRVAEDEE